MAALDRPLMLATALGLAALLAGGCQTISTGHSATPTASGSLEVGASVGGSFPESSPSYMRPLSLRKGNPEAGLRYGVGDHVGVGVRGGPRSAGLDVNVAPYVTSDFALSVNPKITYQDVSSTACSGLGWTGTCQDHRHTVWKGGASLLADVWKVDLLRVTVGAEGGLWRDRRFTKVAGPDAPDRLRAHTPYATGITGIETGGPTGAFFRATYEARHFVGGNPFWKRSLYHTAVVGGGYRF